MLIIPAIDLRNGKVVRLHQGKFNQQKVYSSDPIGTARHWEKQGAEYLHVVDLDGAKSGKICHLSVIKKLVKSVKIPIEVGGGLRDIADIKKVLEFGVDRIVLGTKSQDDSFLCKAVDKFHQKIIVSVDAQNNRVRFNGWQKEYKKSDVLRLIKNIKEIGVEQIIYTDISRDGTLKGPNISMIKRILKNSNLSVIASGGISSLFDFLKLKPLAKDGLTGVIVGKALYEGKFTLKEALIKLKK